MRDTIDIDALKQIVFEDLNDGGCRSPFSEANIAIVIDSDEEAVGEWGEEIESLDVESLTDGEWSLTEPEDGDYGSVVLEEMPGFDAVTEDFDIGKSRHRFKKLF